MRTCTKNHLAGLFALLTLAGCGEAEPAVEPGPIDVRVMSFNVLCSFCDKSYDPWAERVPYIADILTRHDPDLVGLEELTTGDEVREITALVPGYDAVFLEDPDAPLFKEYGDATVLVRSSKFRILAHGSYFLSATPDQNWSSGWAGAQLWRIVTWVHLRQRSDGRELFFAATHFDNNTPNQEKSAPLLLERTEPWAKRMPALAVGDFNSTPDSEAYRLLTSGATEGGLALANTFDAAVTFEQVHNQPATPAWDSGERIDHIFAASPEPWSCARWAVDQTVYGSSKKYPSDHYPIAADVTLE